MFVLFLYIIFICNIVDGHGGGGAGLTPEEQAEAEMEDEDERVTASEKVHTFLLHISHFVTGGVLIDFIMLALISHTVNGMGTNTQALALVWVHLALQVILFLELLLEAYLFGTFQFFVFSCWHVLDLVSSALCVGVTVYSLMATGGVYGDLCECGDSTGDDDDGGHHRLLGGGGGYCCC